MRRLFFSLLFIFLTMGFVYSQDTSVVEETPSNSNGFIYQIGIGSAWSFYFPRIETTVDAMDSASLSRIPFSINFLFGRSLSDGAAWTISLTTSIDSFSASSESLTIYSFLLTGGFQFSPFQKGLILGINGGINLLIPDTDLNYDGDIEFGSGFSLDIGYMFEGMKFGKSGITPGLGIKLIHSELISGSVNQICGYMNLGIR